MTTREIIDIGASANDGTGDTLRSAGSKINNNFEKVFLMLGSDSDYLSERITIDSDGIIHTGPSYTTSIRFKPASINRTVYLPNDDGTLVTDSAQQTLINKSLRLPDIIDSSANEVLLFGSVASAVNYLKLDNAFTANYPTLSAKGSDTNISVSVSGKGSGAVITNKHSVSAETLDSDGASSLELGYTILNSPTALSITLNNGTLTGERKIFTNRGPGTATITPATFGPGTSFQIPQNAACELIWDSAAWYILSVSNDSDISIT